MLKAIVKSLLIHPRYFLNCQHAEAGVKHAEGHLRMVLPTGEVYTMQALVPPIHVGTRPCLPVSHMDGFLRVMTIA